MNSDETEPSAPQTCATHRDQPVAMFCFMCKKPMCELCMQEYGFVCSPYCKGQAERQGIEIPEYDGQRAVVAAHKRHTSKLIGLGVAVLVVALIGAWGWYKFVGSRPRVAFTVDLGSGTTVGTCAFIGSDEALVVKGQRVRLLDVAGKSQRWLADLTHLAASANDGVDAGAWADRFEDARLLRATDTDLWLASGGHIVRLDRATGNVKASIKIPGMMSQLTAGETAIVAVSQVGFDHEMLTHVDLASNAAQTQALTRARVELDEAAAPAPSLDELENELIAPPKHRRELVAAGDSAVEMVVRLVKANIVTVEAMKPASETAGGGKDLTVAESMQAAEELLNEMQRSRTGGVRREDQSLYAVTLRRFFEAGAAEWTGEVTGPPHLFTSKTLDLLVAGQTLLVFDKSNRKLWESNLTYPVSPVFGLGVGAEQHAAPCLEAGDALYFFDQGVLTAFERATGNVRWRLTSVGISKIALDDAGMLYVLTTSAGPESIRYSQQVTLSERVVPVVLKVDPTSGKILWRVEKIGYDFHVAGPFVYLMKTRVSNVDLLAATLNQQADLRVHFRLYRIDPATGKTVWEYYRPEEPAAMVAQSRHILLLFGDRLEVLSFLSL